MAPAPLAKARASAEAVDHDRLERIARRNPKSQGTWEIGSFYSPEPVRERQERPFFPLMTLIVDHNFGLIRSFHMEGSPRSRPRYAAMFLERMYGFMGRR